MSNIYKFQSKTDEPKKISVRQIVLETNDEPSEAEPKEDPNLLLEQAKVTLQQAKRDADKLIEESNQQITLQKEQFEQEKQLIMEQVKKEAFSLGFEEGKKEAMQKYDQDLQVAFAIVKSAQEEQQKWIDKQDNVILEIALKAAERILHYTVQEDEKAFRSLVKGAMEEVSGLQSIALCVHPDDYQNMINVKQEIEQTIGNQASLSIFPNKELAKYSCIIETPFGQIDASIDTQLTELKTKLIDLLEEDKRRESKFHTTVD
ncbi:flagellar assembly protein FliH [Salirhabdus sp. Marseille-P4669]|uniref:flagellar assembly protein FliH n=1 Tax=Salirhabdus sp. Marseille-P4669 TaxID=2042310 RepID=UPI0013573357|nr:flagellar assembly protein FliH [Salirhabdus sp. Marseille-P4669]